MIALAVALKIKMAGILEKIDSYQSPKFSLHLININAYIVKCIILHIMILNFDYNIDCAFLNLWTSYRNVLVSLHLFDIEDDSNKKIRSSSNSF